MNGYDFSDDDIFLENIKRLSSEFDPKSEIFQDYEFSVITDSQLYEDLLGKNTKPFILIQKYVKVDKAIEDQDVFVFLEKEASFNEDKHEEDELIGSPLKVHWQKPLSIIQLDPEKENKKKCPVLPVYHPIFADTARYLVSLYIQCCSQELVDGILPVWVLCDGQDPENTVFIGCEVISESSDLSIYTITNGGPFSSKSKMPSLSALKKKLIPKNVGYLTMYGFSKFDVMGFLDNDSGDPMGSAVLTCHWDKVNSLLEKPPLDAKAVMHLKIDPTDVKNPMFSMYRELKVLQGFIDGLTTGEITWAKESMDQPLTESVTKLLESLKGDIAYMISQNDKEEINFDYPKLSKVLSTRIDLDFTELLWNILIDCQTYQHLIECLELVLKTLQKGEIQPKVHKNNKSTLAELVKDSYYNKLDIPDLNGLLPLRLLAEIGLNKIKADYINAFIGTDLVTMDLLDVFIITGISLQDQLTGLMKLHYVLELVVLGASFLNLTQPTLASYARHGLKHYTENNIDSSYIFDLPVPMSSTSELFENSTANLWKVDLQSRQLNEKKESGESLAIFQISTKPFFDYLIPFRKEDSTDAKFFTTTVIRSKVPLL